MAAAEAALKQADAAEPGNPVVQANLGGILLSKTGRAEAAVAILTGVVRSDPGFDEARFDLALAYAQPGRSGDAAAEARTLLGRLPATAPQRADARVAGRRAGETPVVRIYLPKYCQINKTRLPSGRDTRTGENCDEETCVAGSASPICTRVRRCRLGDGQQTTGNITGRVTDEQGAALPGVTVVAAQTDRVSPERWSPTVKDCID